LFWLSFLGLLALYVAPALIYVNQRNQEVSEEDKVLTKRHLWLLAEHYLKMKPPKEIEQEKVIPIRFIGKTTTDGRAGDPHRAKRAEESKGYKAALEMVYEAIQRRATDIHLEPTKEEMTVRFRIDGILRAETPFRRATGDGVVNIFKVLADLDITE